MSSFAAAEEIEALLREEPALPGVEDAFQRGRLRDLLGWDVTADHLAVLGRVERAAGQGSPRLWLLKLAVLAASVPPADLYDRFAAIGLHTEAKRVADLLLTAGRLPEADDVAAQAEFVRMRTPAAIADVLLLEVALTGRAGADVRGLAGLAGLDGAVEAWESRLRAPAETLARGPGAAMETPDEAAARRPEPGTRRPGRRGRETDAKFGGGELLAVVVGVLLLAGLAFGGWAVFDRTAGGGPKVANDLYARAEAGASARLETANGEVVSVTLAEAWDAAAPDVRVQLTGGGYGPARPGVWSFLLDDGSVIVPVRAASTAGELRLRAVGELPEGTAVLEVRFEPEDRSGSVTFYLEAAGE